MKILLIGAQGQVGFQLQRSLACLGQLHSTTRLDLDLSDISAIRSLTNDVKPDLIVNAAAYTAVDKAEQETELARQINTIAPAIFAEQAKKLAIPLVHYSTDYVFDGSKNSPWIETDVTGPLSHYGLTKLEGEQAILESECDHLIFRTSWVYDRRGHNFLNTMLRLAEERDQLNIVDDQIGTPTWSRHIADVTALALAQQHHNEAFWKQNSGIYHLSAAGQTSWKGFAEAIFKLAEKDGRRVPKVNGIPTTDYPTPAKRPLNSLMDNSKLQQHFGLQLPDWQQSLQWVMQS
ncbi:MAG: dTDP-4-dehydrorhamnose reductase [Methylophaga nitratireducenticrescens]|uniref:dTDP-4-dehydrorhamnose reductase n=1 Tax=Methylophaga sp. SB9B TaxID=2570356 RepID=UPI0010A7F205|nr:dTDP-4-dehydrorhamnose reductase [Methylophaga sp. SB9B]THF72186.1 MAG: dTDP-4-dehydrorhamnose reductase [Methylophaga nitratireducenticrescens]THK43301.1 dTDP-4-dehydrorhamnose reductase [Methylophaga sp. SB9B]